MQQLDPDGTETWPPARLGDITILLPAQTSLAAPERAVDSRAIPYRAETSSLVLHAGGPEPAADRPRAGRPSDALALVTALRSPLFGRGDDDLFGYRVTHGGSCHIHVNPPDSLEATHPVAEAIGYLRGLAQQLPWLTPSELLDRIVRDRRLFEFGCAHGRPR